MENIRELPAESTRAILHGLALQQRERARALSDLARLRKEASAEITRLIAFLDASDPYVTSELEDQVDDGPIDDNELEQNIGPDDRERDDSDLEPSLGACENHPTSPWHGQPHLPFRYDNSGGQQLWAASGPSDREDEHDGREPDGLLDWQQGAMA